MMAGIEENNNDTVQLKRGSNHVHAERTVETIHRADAARLPALLPYLEI